MYFLSLQKKKYSKLEKEVTENIEPKQNKKKRIILKIISVLFFLFVIVDVFLIFFATPLLKNYLQEKVKQETEGLFSVDFEKISIEIGFRRLSLEKFEMISDSSVYKKLINENKAKAALYNISCSSLELKGTNIYRLFFKNELKIKEFRLNKPIVELKKLPKKEADTKNRDFVHEDLFPAISPYLKEINITNIILEDGKFNLNIKKDSLKKTNHVGNLSIKLRNFLLNERQFLKKKKLFYSDDINIEINDYKIILSDNIHYFFADNISLSTEKSLLVAKSVKINPINNSKQHLDTITQNYFRLNTSIIELKNFDVSKLYFDKDINIQQLTVENPKIYIINKFQVNKKKRVKKQSKQIDLYQLIKDKFNSVTIDSLKINRSVVNFYYNSDIGNKAAYESKNLNLKLYNLMLNQYAKDDKSKIFYSNDICFSIKSFSALIPNNIHRLDVENIKADTRKKELSASNIKFTRKRRNLRRSLKNKSVFNINIPNLDLQGINYKYFYHTKNLYFHKVNFSASNLKASIYKKKKGKAVLKDLFSGFVKSIFIQNFNIKKSKFNLKIIENDSVFQNYTGKLIFNLYSFNLNKYKNKDKLFFANDFKLQLFDYQQDLKDNIHKLNLEDVTISSIDSMLYISKLSVKPKENLKTYKDFKDNYINKVYDFTLRNSKITGIDINKAATDSALNIAEFSINKPKFRFFNYIDIENLPDSLTQKEISELDSNYLDKKGEVKEDRLKFKGKFIDILSQYYSEVSIKRFNLKKGDFKIVEIDSNLNLAVMMSGKITTRIKDFKFDTHNYLLKNKFSYSDNIQFAVDDFKEIVSKKNYEFKIKRFVFSSKDSVFTANIITLFPKEKIYYDKSVNNVFTIYSPYISTKSTNISELINLNILDIGRLTVENPVIAIYKKKQKSINKQKIKNKKQKSNFPFESIKLEKIKLLNGIFGILKHKNDFKKLAINTKFNFELNNFELDSIKLKNHELLFKNLDIVAQLENLHYQMPDSIHYLSVKNININTLKSKITGSNLLYNNIEANKIFRDINKNHIDTIKTPNFSISGLKLDKLLLNKSLILDSLQIENPYIEILDYKQSKSKNNFNNLNLYKKIYPKLNAINISDIKVNKLSIKLTANNKSRKFGNIFKNLFLSLNNLIIDSTNQIRKNKILNADDISFKIKDYSINLSDSLYNFKFKEFGISTALRRAYIDAIKLNPNIERDVFAEKFKKDFSFNYLFGKKIIVNDIDIESFFNKNKIIVNNINLFNFNLHSYKNKKYPLDSIQRIALPLDYLKEINNYLLIDTLNIYKSNLEFEMLEKNASNSGILFLSDIKGQMTNITNDKEKIKNGEATTLDFSAYIMDEGLISVAFNFPLNSKYGEYNYAGTIAPMDLRLINPFIENVASVSLKSGYLNGVDFKVQANEKYSLGKIKLAYNKLKINVVKKKTNAKTEKRGLVSLVANSIIKDSNPKFKRGIVKEKRIYFERNIYKPVFHFWTQSLLAGAKNTLGFKSKDLKKRLKFEKEDEKLRKNDERELAKIKRRDEKKLLKETKKQNKDRKKEGRSEKNKNE